MKKQAQRGGLWLPYMAGIFACVGIAGTLFCFYSIWRCNIGVHVLGGKEAGMSLRRKTTESFETRVITFAHEIGHACGLRDIYNSYKISGSNRYPPIEDIVKEVWVPDDWSGGTEYGHYPADYPHERVIRTMLMYGNVSSLAVDIPCGDIYGINENNQAELIYLGKNTMNRNPNHE